MSHSLIDDVGITLSESNIDRESQYYGLLSYLNYVIEKPQKAKTSHLKFYEGQIIQRQDPNNNKNNRIITHSLHTINLSS